MLKQEKIMPENSRSHANDQFRCALTYGRFHIMNKLLPLPALFIVVVVGCKAGSKPVNGYGNARFGMTLEELKAAHPCADELSDFEATRVGGEEDDLKATTCSKMRFGEPESTILGDSKILTMFRFVNGKLSAIRNMGNMSKDEWASLARKLQERYAGADVNEPFVEQLGTGSTRTTLTFAKKSVTFLALDYGGGGDPEARNRVIFGLHYVDVAAYPQTKVAAGPVAPPASEPAAAAAPAPEGHAPAATRRSRKPWSSPSPRWQTPRAK
jgi:hypothetical protein